MDKVKLTRKQAVVLETELKSSHINGDKSKFVKMYVNLDDNDWDQGYPLTCLTSDEIIRALYIGYEVEITPEDRIKDKYKNPNIHELNPNSYRTGIYDTLNILNIKIEGVNT